MALVLMEQDGEIEIEYNHGLSDDGELAEVPDVGIIIVHMSYEEDAIDS